MYILNSSYFLTIEKLYIAFGSGSASKFKISSSANNAYTKYHIKSRYMAQAGSTMAVLK